PPEGHRAVFSNVPQFDYRTMTGEDLAVLNALNLIAVMLESRTAIENTGAIAAVPGIDVIGANDLCLDLGVPGEPGHAKVADAFARMIEACRAHHKWPGMGGIYDER